jgi:hypothetical protein
MLRELLSNNKWIDMMTWQRRFYGMIKYFLVLGPLAIAFSPGHLRASTCFKLILEIMQPQKQDNIVAFALESDYQHLLIKSRSSIEGLTNEEVLTIIDSLALDQEIRVGLLQTIELGRKKWEGDPNNLREFNWLVSEYVGRLGNSTLDDEQFKIAKREVSDKSFLDLLSKGYFSFSERTNLKYYEFPHEERLQYFHQKTVMEYQLLDWDELIEIIDILNISNELKVKLRSALDYRLENHSDDFQTNDLSRWFGMMAGSINDPYAMHRVEEATIKRLDSIRNATPIRSVITAEVD